MAASHRKRKRAQSLDPGDPPYEHQHARIELDSHADTCAFGSACLVLQETGRTVAVEGFGEAMGLLDDVPIVTAAIAYDCPTTARTYVLIYHESLYIPDMTTHLVNPMQMRQQGITVNDIPLQLMSLEERQPQCHSISFDDPPLHIPLTLNGIMSGFTVRVPTWEEVRGLGQDNLYHVHMTSSQPWDPHSPTYSKLEGTLRDTVTRGMDLIDLEPRDLSQLQARGQQQEPGVSLPTDYDDDTCTHARPVSLKALQQEQRHHAALEVDRYADALLAELGVTEKGLSDMSHCLASAPTQKKRSGFVDAQTLARNWKIGVEAAKRTIESTTQMAVRDFTNTTGSKRLKPSHTVLDHDRLQSELYTDTFFGKCKSLRGNTCAQIYASTFHWIRAFSMESKKDAHYTLDHLFKDVGVPQMMIPDNAMELTRKEFKRKCRSAQCPIRPVEAYTPNKNLAEAAIRELKRHYRRVMLETQAPEVLWDYCLEWCAMIRSHTALNIHELDGKTPATRMTGDTSDISFLAEFGWYDWVWYIDPQGGTGLEATGEPTLSRKKLGRYLGPATNVGSAMCGTVLTAKGTRVDRTSIIPLSVADQNSDPIKKMKGVFEEVLKSKLKDRVAAMKAGKDAKVLEEEELGTPVEETPEHVPYEQWDPSELGFQVESDGKEELPELAEADDLDLDRYISAKVMLPKDGHTFASGRVVRRARNPDGELIGKSSHNPLLDSSVYEVEFEDGSVERYNANIIAEHIYSKLDGDGYGTTLLDEIIDHRSDDSAVQKEDGGQQGPNGETTPRQTTKGWWLLVRMKDHSTEWYKLKDIKQSNPLEVAQYAVDNKLEEEPAFRWWVPFTIRKRNRILKAMTNRYHRTVQKFGIELPKTVERALEIDKETNTTFWRDAINKEMKTVKVAFQFLPEGAAKPVGREYIGCHLVFDVKQGTLQRKCRFVADGSRTETTVPTYASVVSRESVRIAFTLAALNGLDILGADCEGAYLNADTREKLYTKCGSEFGPEYKGRYALIVRALYGTKSGSSSWRARISSIIEDLGFTMCRADNDVWMRPGVNAAGEDVWEYVLVYSDDLLMIALHPGEIAARIDQHCKLKAGSVKEPDQYLGANIGKMEMPNGTTAWYSSSADYCKAAVQNIEAWLEKKGEGLPTKTACVFPSGWKPELDVTPELKDEDVSFYQQQIGVLRWMVELGRVDICTEVSMLAGFSACPRQGHLAAVIHLYAYLKKHPRSKLVFDPTPMAHDAQEAQDWRDFYGPQKEIIPPDQPEPRGKAIQTTCFVDSDHAGDQVTRRSRTGVLIFLGMAPVVFYSKKQGSIETSSFGSELSAMKTAVELLEGLRYKLRMMGVPLEGPAYVKADNMSVVHNCSNPASQLKKKSNSIAYHYVRERCAADVCSISYVPTTDNLADMFTKSQPGEVRRRLADRVLY